MLESSLIRDGISHLTAKVRGSLADSTVNAVKELDHATPSGSSFRDILQLSEGHPPSVGSENPRLMLQHVRSPMSLKGGHNPIQAMKDQLGQLWIFKAVFQRGAPYRAVGDKAGSDLARAVGIPTPPVQYASELMKGDVRFGTLSPMIKHSGKRLSADMTELTETQKKQLLQSHVFRWLIGDHDGKAANFLVLNDKSLVPIDFGNMYRNFSRDSLDRFYQPNPITPVYNQMWDAYVKGQIDLDFKAGLKQVGRIERLPDTEFMRLLKPYADARYAQPGFRPKGLETKEQFLKKALDRKHSLRKDIIRFYDSLAKERGPSGAAL